MNRGRKRGGMGLSGLRECVKRRLFDPNIVPLKPCPSEAIANLEPLKFGKPIPKSRLAPNPEANISITSDDVVAKIEFSDATKKEDKSENESYPGISERCTADSLQTELFHKSAMFEYTFAQGPFYNSLPGKVEGLHPPMNSLPSPVSKTRDDNTEVFSTGYIERQQSSSLHASVGGKVKGLANLADTGVHIVHLLLMHDSTNEMWADGGQLNSFIKPREMYPAELLKRLRRPLRKAPKKHIKKGLGDDLISDNALEKAIDEAEIMAKGATEDDDNNAEDENDENDSDDSEDARWNAGTGKSKKQTQKGITGGSSKVRQGGRAKVDGTVEELDDEDEDELDNDYCQAYFDNGEGVNTDDEMGGYTIGGEDGAGDGDRNYYD